ncbi:DUF5718 family protein [Photobacterium swingsii]|uniref:DUF5718 family protein n=1 Tax=Photobacterium swingsii TaxID=680026 RepID=UPI003D134790
MKCFSLGIIGNFSGHLSGAEKVEESHLPNGLFVVKDANSNAVTTGEILNFPPHGENIQAEPEFVVKFDVEYDNNHVKSLSPRAITVGNDMTIRKLEGATKIAERKSWGCASKGVATHWWNVDQLETYDHAYKLVSIVKRNGKSVDYTPIADPSELKIFYREMCDWLVNTMNSQASQGICKEILPQLAAADYPSEVVIFCGAPNYTTWGETYFIQPNDEISIALVNSKKISVEDITTKLKSGVVINDSDVISYSQKVI